MTRPWREIAFELGLAALITVFAAVALWQSWGRWLDPIIDAGRDLYIPEQIRGGSQLYRDILYFYPPLTPYLLALITSITGSSLRAYTGIGIAISSLLGLVLWLSLRRIASPVASAAAVLLFVTWSMCGASSSGANFVYPGANFIFPYAHATTLGMLFLMTTMMSLLARVNGDRHRYEWLAIVAALAAFWTKIEHAVFATALLVAVAIVHRLWRMLSLYVAGVAITLLIAVTLLPGLRENVFPGSLLAGESLKLFYARVIGLDHWRDNVVASMAAAFLIALIAGLLAAATRSEKKLTVIGAIALAVAASFLLFDEPFFRAWTILQLVLVPFALRRPREPLAILLFTSLCASSRIFLNLAPKWYGFVFMVPVYVLLVYVLLEWLPARGIYSRRMSAFWVVLIVAVAGRGLLLAGRAQARKQYPIVTNRGTFLDGNRDRAGAITELLAQLDREKASTLVVMPEGLSLNYFSSVRDPLTFQTFTPVEIANDVTESKICDEIVSRKPQFVAIVSRDVREFGYRGFGQDYARPILGILSRDYALVRRWSLPHYQQLLLRRKR